MRRHALHVPPVACPMQRGQGGRDQVTGPCDAEVGGWDGMQKKSVGGRGPWRDVFRLVFSPTTPNSLVFPLPWKVGGEKGLCDVSLVCLRRAHHPPVNCHPSVLPMSGEWKSGQDR